MAAACALRVSAWKVFILLGLLLGSPAASEQTEQRSAFGLRPLHSARRFRESEDGAGQLVVVFQGDRPPLVERVKRPPIVARETVTNRGTDGTLDVLVTDLREPVRAADDYRHLVFPV